MGLLHLLWRWASPPCNSLCADRCLNHDVKGLLLEGHMRRALPSNRFRSLPFFGASLTVKSVTCLATTSVSPPSLPPPQPPPPQLSLGPQPTLPPLTGEKNPTFEDCAVIDANDAKECREQASSFVNWRSLLSAYVPSTVKAAFKQ